MFEARLIKKQGFGKNIYSHADCKKNTTLYLAPVLTMNN